MSANQYDFQIYDGGSLVLLTPLNEQALTWLKGNVSFEEWQVMGSANSIAIDARFVPVIQGVIEEEGFTYEMA